MIKTIKAFWDTIYQQIRLLECLSRPLDILNKLKRVQVDYINSLENYFLVISLDDCMTN